MSKPDFFIIGAPKCGTTSLITYLSKHKQVCVSNPKEPHYFLSDLPQYRQTKDLNSYEGCFQCHGDSITRIGEASTWYLFSKEAVKNILEYCPDAKIIAMIRNPIDMAESLYKQFVYGLEEDANTFEEAWNLQKERAKGNHIPKYIVEPSRLQYFDVCSLGTQLKRVIDIVPNNQLKIILFDDFINDTQKVYASVLSFLDLYDDGQSHFPVFNQKKKNRLPGLSRFIITNKIFNESVEFLKKTLCIKKLGVSKYVLSLNVKTEKKIDMDHTLRQSLVDAFSQEVLIIEQLLGISLFHWRK